MSAPLERHGIWGWRILGVLALAIVLALAVQPIWKRAVRELETVFAPGER